MEDKAITPVLFSQRKIYKKKKIKMQLAYINSSTLILSKLGKILR